MRTDIQIDDPTTAREAWLAAVMATPIRGPGGPGPAPLWARLLRAALDGGWARTVGPLGEEWRWQEWDGVLEAARSLAAAAGAPSAPYVEHGSHDGLAALLLHRTVCGTEIELTQTYTGTCQLTISSCSHDDDTPERRERADHELSVRALVREGREAESVSRRTHAAALVVAAWEREQSAEPKPEAEPEIVAPW